MSHLTISDAIFAVCNLIKNSCRFASFDYIVQIIARCVLKSYVLCLNWWDRGPHGGINRTWRLRTGWGICLSGVGTKATTRNIGMLLIWACSVLVTARPCWPCASYALPVLGSAMDPNYALQLHTSVMHLCYAYLQYPVMHMCCAPLFCCIHRVLRMKTHSS